ncbi:sporulation-control protein [Bacillus mesophilus]|uniref:Sporulation protein n=1 Tax=Bacillus mesophilus TaxID=1808955 RepID=A0A6M0QA92_9BACI|nr:sporulation protein [Bacillus mesophilus]MBM7662640.1 sporulation-control protein [Bacillus mesophilus]NEY73294.1 sporulation protein [Bacillus mesophilus]
MRLKKYMSLLGIGSAKVDLVLEKGEAKLGECIKGSIHIDGGNIEQHLKRIECDLVKTDNTHREEVVETKTILTNKVIDSENHKEIPFSFYIPETLIPSSDCLTYRFKTRLVFNEGLKSLDQDTITILVT